MQIKYGYFKRYFLPKNRQRQSSHSATISSYKTPFELGNSSPSIRIACLNVLPNTLNKLSILWWSLSPVAFKCNVASSEKARDWKKCSVSSVLKSPTLSRLNLALNLIHGRPDKSKAGDAAFVTDSLFQCGADREGGVFHGVVFVNV